ncbi:MAG: TRAP transporter substrate-binding protein DctP [Thermoanaerobaculia bacterium]
MNSRTAALLAAALVLVATGPVPAAAAPIKLATLVPEGSIWDKDLREMGDQWRRKTDGRVSLRIYAGGVAGSETDILRKIRIGQLHAAALTVAGLEEIDGAFSVLVMPLFYDSYAEFLYVLDGLAPTLEELLEAKGYRLLQWGHGGWVRFFSRDPIRSITDLKKQKIYVTAGADHMVTLWQENGFRPVPLAPTDIMTGFQTGMIDVIATTPLAALSLQWFRQASFMEETGLAPLPGATIVSARAWNGISEADRQILLGDAAIAEKRQRGTIPEQDQIAVDEMSERGLEITAAETSVEWSRTAARIAESMRGRTVPQEIYDAAVRLRSEYRARSEPDPAADEPAPATPAPKPSGDTR